MKKIDEFMDSVIDRIKERFGSDCVLIINYKDEELSLHCDSENMVNEMIDAAKTCYINGTK